jgi:RNA polymerase sigma factor (sigma-70 family)
MTAGLTMEELFLEQLPVIERAIAFVCRRYEVHGADAEDFASSVKLKLIENDYAVLRKFEGRSTFAAFIGVTIRRMLLDQLIHERGKWHPSTAARRLGNAAVELETHLYRDGRPLHEVLPVVASAHRLTLERVEALAGQLPRRLPRFRAVDLDVIDAEANVPLEILERAALAADHTAVAQRAGMIIEARLQALTDDDRRILRLRFFAGLTTAEIARVLHLDQKPLYRRIDRYLREIRQALQEGGICSDDLDDIVERIPDDFAIAVREAAAHLPASSRGASDENGAAS